MKNVEHIGRVTYGLRKPYEDIAPEGRELILKQLIVHSVRWNLERLGLFRSLLNDSQCATTTKAPRLASAQQNERAEPHA